MTYQKTDFYQAPNGLSKLFSRTSKLGVVVAIAGIVCVCIRLLIGVLFRNRSHSTLDLLLAAL